MLEGAARITKQTLSAPPLGPCHAHETYIQSPSRHTRPPLPPGPTPPYPWCTAIVDGGASHVGMAHRHGAVYLMHSVSAGAYQSEHTFAGVQLTNLAHVWNAQRYSPRRATRSRDDRRPVPGVRRGVLGRHGARVVVDAVGNAGHGRSGNDVSHGRRDEFDGAVNAHFF